MSVLSPPRPPAKSKTAPNASIPRLRKRSFRQRLRRDKVMLALVLPGFLFFVVFNYIPLLGNIVAFLDYRP
ncbi:ABC-type sugar transport system, permease component [Renibacterium salmoninarum ATCC 33209]|uniref:ABC-type sugar transport system, permease component n=1 Tax=Renibacterium salmoninarum (strain ATCC 33209 / DSM 20767 / JCM 11484 / NBRC 15589 / NCIMB 2235) TaxID=288705 RepID=A9WKQ9_RENSM|nr:sugar ABC transporter permease [Renibacterium salmoninarum]ABY21868.1 ABC-type sugar transport system, permease component [Renibacterium salmoninarum ATCC 33209]